MMSDTSARASLFARWFGSLERNGLRGRLAPPSFVAGAGAEGGVGGGGGGDAGRIAGGTKGGPEDGVNGGESGGLNGVGSGEANSGKPDDGDGGVAVAAAVVRSIDSGRGRAAAETSELRICGGGGGGAARCIDWVAELPGLGVPKGAASHPP